jgi:hypothetical protein
VLDVRDRWHRMKVNGQVMPTAALKSNDRIEFGRSG